MGGRVRKKSDKDGAARKSSTVVPDAGAPRRRPPDPELIQSERVDRAAAAVTASGLRQTLALDGRATLRMRGRSMWPVIRDGDEVVLRPVRPGEPIAGMVVAAEQDDRVVVHRVESVSEGGIVCRGIGREDPDPPCSRSDVLGVAIRIAGVPLGESGLRSAAGLATRAVSGARRVRRWLGGKAPAAGEESRGKAAPRTEVQDD